MDRLYSFRVFIEVAQVGSFSGAARHLGVSKATVTKHVAALEGALGARLLERTTQYVRLTDAGVTALENGTALLERYEEIEADVRDALRNPSGVVRIGTPPSFGTHHLVPLLVEFSAAHPDIRIELALDDGTANLVAQGLDLSVRIAPGLKDASYVAQPLARARQVLVASPSYLRAHGTPASWADLAGHRCLVHSLKSPTGIWRATGPGGEVTVRVRGPIASSIGEPLRHAALLGHGISMHPYYMVSDDLTSGRLQVVLADHEPQGLEIYVIFPSRRSLPLRVRRFIDFLRDWAKAPPGWAQPLESAGRLPAVRAGGTRRPKRTLREQPMPDEQ